MCLFRVSRFVTTCCAGSVLGLLLVTVAPAEAQSTREEEHARKQAEKAAVVAPYKKNAAEKTIDRLEDWGLLTGTPKGVYPWFGSVYPSGGLAGGAGFRQGFRDTGAISGMAGWSVRAFKLGEVNLHLPEAANRSIVIDITGRWLDAPQIRYFGYGNDSRRSDRTSYGLTMLSGGINARLKPARWFHLGGGVEHLDVDTGSGVGRDPTIETIFTEGSAPGLGTDPKYFRSRAFLLIDWRKQPGYRGRGGLYRVEATDYSAQSGGRVSFRQLEAEIVQLIPFVAANWVIALRGLATTTDTERGNIVPFYFAPSIGGGTTVRGYPDFRFRGNHRIVVNAEYRWTAARFLDMAIFYDAGKVTDNRRDLDLDGVKTSVGIGARFHGAQGTVMRWEVARSREHAYRFIWSFGAAF